MSDQVTTTVDQVPYTPPKDAWEELEDYKNTVSGFQNDLSAVPPPSIDHLELHTHLRTSCESFVMDANRYEHEHKTMTLDDSIEFSDRYQNIKDACQTYLDCNNDLAKLAELEKAVRKPPQL